MTLTPSQIRFEAALKNGAASGVSPVLRDRLEWSAAIERAQERTFQQFLLLDDTASPFEGIEMTNIIENAREAIEQAFEDFQQVCWELYGDPEDEGGEGE